MQRSVSLVLALLVGSLVGFACGNASRTCSPTSCSGCCDQLGECQFGSLQTACGSGGELCRSCIGNQLCTVQGCSTGGVGGGGGATGGGTGGGSGGGATGGGSGGGVTGGGSGGGATGGGGGATGGGTGGGATGGGSGGGAVVGGGGGSSCGPGSCDGCCGPGDACLAGRNISACGFAGATCTVCGLAQSCVPVNSGPFGGQCQSTNVGGGGGGGFGGGGGSGGGGGGGFGGGGGGGFGGGGGVGSCTNCPGCCASGVCQPGNQTLSCGLGGAVCQQCLLTQTCWLGQCTFPTGGGGGSTGGGAGGGGFGGGGGGFDFDGGLSDECDATRPCPGNECCDSIFLISECVQAGQMCSYSPNPVTGGICNGQTRQCQ